MGNRFSVFIAIIVALIGLAGSFVSGDSKYIFLSLFPLGLELLILFQNKKEKQKQQNKEGAKPSAREREDSFKMINLPPGVDRSQVDSIGLEMRSGYWILLKDDTLYFREGDYLGNGTYGRYRHRVKRIVIEDYRTVQLGAFMGFSECREVVFTNPSVILQTAAFKHCHKLENVYFAGKCEAMDDVFRDTPYEAKLQNVEFVPEYLRGSVIAQGEWGRKFLENTRREIELMYTPEGPQDDIFEYTTDWLYDDHGGGLYSFFGFADSFESIIRGGVAGEPEMLYLLAEMFYYNIFTNITEAAMDALGYFSDEFKNVTFCDLYLRAAEAGSALAGLWCAYSMDTGKNGFPSDPQRAEDILGKITKIPDTLALRELSFLAEEADKLTQKAYDVDAEEDEIANQYDFKPGTYEHLLPDPDWQKLHARSDNVLSFMLAIGLPYIIGKRFYNGSYCDEDSDIKRIAADKSAWLDWCRKKGIDIELM